MKKIFLSISLSILFLGVFAQSTPISLKGKWQVRIDSLNVGTKENWQNNLFSGQAISLPGTLDDAKIGETPTLDTSVLNKEIMTMLTRKHRYVGVAWYQREINLSNNISNGEIFLERVIWKTDCWIDGKYLGNQSSLIAPHKFNTGSLKAGKHTIVLKIDNSKQFDISLRNMAHAYTDGTQIIWNGVIGSMRLTAENDAVIKDLQVYPDLATQSVNAKLAIENKTRRKKNLLIKIWAGNKEIASKTVSLAANSSESNTKIQLKNIKPWSEFNPQLYKITAQILDKKDKVIAEKQSQFGFRDLGNTDAHLSLNGKRIFLRGTLDCDIYPLEGHPPMEKTGWLKVFNTAKSYGLNHIRYHSWCPPEAAFEVADSMGFYLQVELPLWELNVGKDKPTLAFLKTEAQKILSNYGNHPSFCFFSMGNELQGDFDWLNTLVAELKKQDNRRFYTATTFTFEKGHGRWPEPNDDYFVTQYTKKGWVRGQGVFNAEKPNFITDYSKSVEGIPVPLVTHEVGQYSVFPNLKEIDKYTGVLEPLNFKAVKYDMQKKDLLQLADSFTLASGKFAINLYKEEIERALKTNNISGFQLLDLHDFPGQGTALVGLLDAFWESKGLIKPENFREFCSPVVPLLRFKKASYLNNENFKATIQVSNFSGQKLDAAVNYEITTKSGLIVFSGSLPKKEIDLGSSNLGEINLDLSKIYKPEALNIKVSIPHTVYQNHWTIWVYPSKQETSKNNVLFTTSKEAAFKALSEGKTVVFNPDTSQIIGVDGRFTSVFWSPVHFPDQPGTMGLLLNPQHPALAAFPTEFYSNWQWWDLVTSSKTMIIDSLPEISHPVVRVIDNFFKNRKMADVIEAKVGNGKLILCSMDISHDLDNRIEARQLKYSLMAYADSEKFNPKVTITQEQLSKLLK
ncbi:sugar-binding domain-containing protein [Pedobacter segetis]|nr:sugar-binding domain-containing protein [Pedobacter segetis]